MTYNLCSCSAPEVADCGSCCALDLGEILEIPLERIKDQIVEHIGGVPVKQIKEDIVQNLVGEQIVDVPVPPDPG